MPLLMSIQIPSCLAFYNICEDNPIQIAIEIDKVNKRFEAEEEEECKEMKVREKIEVEVEIGIAKLLLPLVNNTRPLD